MPLEAGTHLGPYVIVSPIGEGGMGEVYRARDTRLGRTVAIKTIHSSALGSDQARVRFQREARAISSLTHPNICTLHDVGQQNGVDYLVMEHLEGDSLADRLGRGQLPLDDVIRYGIEIASALEHAHRHGVIHRDLKPGNILLTKSGAKLLDFGLARTALSQDSRTMEKAITADGAIPGTLQFVAPEQLAGKEADARSDIFAFGNVLYRMATGRPPFAGDSAGALIASISRDEPQPIEPAALNDLVGACLKKDPDERMQSAHDCKLALEWMRGARPAAKAPTKSGWLPIAIAALCGALIPIAIWFAVRPKISAPLRQFTIDLPAPIDLSNSSDLAFAPDGSSIVVAVDTGSGRQLYLRLLDQSAFVPLDGTRGAIVPFFSPDGKWIGFGADGKLKKVRVSGGAAVTICDAPRLRGATWGPDDTIVFAPVSTGGGLARVAANGGEVTALTAVDFAHGERSHRYPHFLPDGKHVMFSLEDWGADYSRKAVAVVDLETKQRTTILKGATDGRLLSKNLLIFGGDKALFAVHYDPATQRVSGLPVPVLEHVLTHVGLGRAYADFADDGTVVYAPYDATSELRRVFSVDRHGNATLLLDDERLYQSVRFSPDGEQVLVATGDYLANDLWLVNVARKSWSRVAPEGKNMSPIWSRTGDQIFFASNRSGMYNVFSMPVDGSGAARQITNREYWPFPCSISPDGRTLIVAVQHPVTSYDLWTIDLSTGRESPLLVGPYDQPYAVFSPDGHWIAYMSNESGRSEIYVQHFPATGRRWLVSRDGGAGPVWQRNEIFFRSGKKMMVANVSTQPALVIATPRELFEGDYDAGYDLSPDGQRFVMLKRSRPPAQPQLNVILGAAGDIARRVRASEKRD